MMVSVNILNIILCLLYSSIFGIYTAAFMRKDDSLKNKKRVLLISAVLIHILYLVLRTLEFGHPPLTNKFEILTLLAFSLAVTYLVLEIITKVRQTGAFILFFPAVLQIISAIYIKPLIKVDELLNNPLLIIHVSSAILAYSAFTISAVYGGLYLMLYKEIKLSSFGLIFNRLPNLEILDKLSSRSAVIGFVLLSFSIIVGFIWMRAAFPNFSYFDPKLIISFIVWLVYGTGISLRYFIHLRGRGFIRISILGFITAVLSLIITGMITASFHSFNN